MHQTHPFKNRSRFIKNILSLIILLAFFPMACGNGAPSDTQIAKTLIRDFKKLEQASLGFTKAALEDIRIGYKRRLRDRRAYEIEVTATVATRIGGMNAVRPCTTKIKLKKINNRWTLID